MSNPELFNDDFWTTKSSSTPPSASAQTGGSSGKEDPPPKCEGCDSDSPYGEGQCDPDKSCCPGEGGGKESSSSINYSNGGTKKSSKDAGTRGGAVPWNSTRTQDSRDQFDRMRAAGTGWKSSETAKVEQYPNFYRVEFSEKDAVNFSLIPDSSGIYRALDNFPETLTIDSNTNIYTIVRKNGTSWDFNGNIPSSALAVLQRVENEEGKQTLFSYDSAGRLVTVQQLSESSQVVSEMGYTYEPNQPERIAEIVVRGLNSGTLGNQNRVVYTYYQDGDSFGNSSDLKTVEKFLWSESEGAWKAGSAEYYRYYTQSNAFGRQHQLRMEFNAVDFAFLREKFRAQWQFVSDETAVGYSTQYYEYNVQNKVALTRVSRNRFLYQYEYVTYVENRDYNAVSCKTLERGPHGERTTVFTNFNGDVLLREIVHPDIQEEKKNGN